MRFFVLPDALIELLIFPISLGCFIWQSVVIFRYWNKASNADTTLSAISSIIFLAMTISSALGYVFMAMMILFWWQAQLICIIIIMALNQILKKNRSRTENRKKIYLKKTLGKVRHCCRLNLKLLLQFLVICLSATICVYTF